MGRGPPPVRAFSFAESPARTWSKTVSHHLDVLEAHVSLNGTGSRSLFRAWQIERLTGSIGPGRRAGGGPYSEQSRPSFPAWCPAAPSAPCAVSPWTDFGVRPIDAMMKTSRGRNSAFRASTFLFPHSRRRWHNDDTVRARRCLPSVSSLNLHTTRADTSYSRAAVNPYTG